MKLSDRLKKLAAVWDVLEQVLLGLLVGGMVVLSALQIVLRNFFQTGIAWVEPLLGSSVLWITMLGALAATGVRKHIKIDIASAVLPLRPREALLAITHLFAAAVCGLLSFASTRFVIIQREMGGNVLLNVPAWTVYSVMPVVFALIAFRFVLQAVIAFGVALGPRAAHKPESGNPGAGDSRQETRS